MKWPTRLVLIRHAESEFNALWPKKISDPDYLELRKLYEKEILGYEHLAQKGRGDEFQFSRKAVRLAKKLQRKYLLPCSEADVPLTEKGKEQARLTGLALQKQGKLPHVVFTSPYLRTSQTLSGVAQGFPALSKVRVIADERIRERNIGELELYGDAMILNVIKIKQAKLSHKQGGYNYRFPQGESMVDVQTRNRLWFETLTRDHPKEEVWVFSHGLTILSIRSLFEYWTPEKFIRMERDEAPRNCSLTIYRGDPSQGRNGRLILQTYNQLLF